MHPFKLSLSELERFCHVVGRSLQSGQSFIDALQTYGRTAKWKSDDVIAAVQRGEHAADAMKQSGSFPPLLVGMAEVGESSGRLGETFLRMADYYRELVRSRRVFQQGLVWPVIQLIAALAVLSLLFLGLEYLKRKVTSLVPPDLFGLGLTPLQNLALVWTVAAVLSIVFLVLAWWLRRGQVPGVIAVLVHRIPAVGTTLKRISVSRFAWALGASIDAGTDAATAIRMGIRGSGDARLRRVEAGLLESIERGESFESALAATGAFPRELVQTVSLGESTGQVTECVERLAEEYDERNALALRRFGQVSGLIVSLAVIALLGGTTISMYARYLQMVDGALQANSSTLDRLREETLAAMSGESLNAAGGPASIREPQSDNELIQTRDQMVEDFVENNEDFKQIESMYSTLRNFNSMTGNEFLDAIAGETPAQKSLREMKEMEKQSENSKGDNPQ